MKTFDESTEDPPCRKPLLNCVRLTNSLSALLQLVYCYH